jgi:redox-sensitive bicupin YhaK (pirin superfamily)
VNGGDIERVLAARSAELPGGLHVLRALPQAQQRMVGPFVFLDQMGPVNGPPMAVAPHPHIGLSTVTYLFEGEAIHRDSLGTVQRIAAGDVNWMTAGRGIAHSERGPKGGGRTSGIQIWVALPKQHEETEPTFAHHPASTLPVLEPDGMRLKLVAGTLWGARSPVKTHSELFYAVAEIEASGLLHLPPEHEERAAYLVEGRLEPLSPGELAVFRPGADVCLRAEEPSRVLLFGGATMDAPRHIWWNFVSSSRDRIEQAKEDWRRQRFGAIPEETDFIPLPER